ncbi:hypothetical protein CCP4SC76_2290009 [Gammaproteobacteria bacterium]
MNLWWLALAVSPCDLFYRKFIIHLVLRLVLQDFYNPSWMPNPMQLGTLALEFVRVFWIGRW